MPHLILKKYKSSERTELTFDNVDVLSVQELRETVSTRMGVSLDELKLVYDGRILKSGKQVVDYDVVAGCTIHVMLIKPKKSVERRSRSGGKGGLMKNRRVLAMIGRIMGNPVIFQGILQSTASTGNNAMLQLLSDPRVSASLSDPDNIQEYFQDNPEVSAMMEQIIQQFLGSSVEGVVGGEDEEQLIDLLENHVEEEMAQVEREREIQRTQAQEQMFEHSQALHAHHQQQQRQLNHHPHSTSSFSSTINTSAMQETSFNPLSSQQHGSLYSSGASGQGITQDQLRSALASAMSSTSSSPRPLHSHTSPLASLDFSQISSGPSSLSSDQPGSLPSNPAPPPYSSLQPLSSSAAPETSRGPISATTLQQALSNVRGSSQVGTGMGNVDSHSRYRAQLEQLHFMGITDDTACLHALVATGGDLQAALEILYSK